MKKILIILVFSSTIIFGQSLDSSNTSSLYDFTSSHIEWISLSEAEKLSNKYRKNILLYFFREECDFCAKMKQETFTDHAVIRLINNNFFPVMLNGKSKDSIIYNNIVYVNDKPNIEDQPSFHNLFKELVDLRDGNYYWPTIVIINPDHQKVIQGSGFWPKELTLRNLKYIISSK